MGAVLHGPEAMLHCKVVKYAPEKKPIWGGYGTLAVYMVETCMAAWITSIKL